ncbi:MAG TPA: transketolase [Candidatus Babeliales bacterium]|jgi:transketolase|nr:transketolase [Candidatus Babeliales bacterium]
MKKMIMQPNRFIEFIEHKAYIMRCWAVKAPAQAGSGHTTSCLSAADIVAVLFFYAMRYDPYYYGNPDNDRFILSKGHAAPLLYAAWRELDLLTDEEMLSYRKFDSVLEGHPTRRFPYAETATGSLGIGLSVGVGLALCAKLDKRAYRTYVLMGDSESSEGSVWEAVQLAAHYNLDNLIAFIDVNNLGQSSETMLDYQMKRYVDMCTAFGWQTFDVDGHNVKSLMEVIDKAHQVVGKPVMIIAKTVKGYGIDFVAGLQGFHGKAFVHEKEKEALEQLEKNFPQSAHYKDDFEWQAPRPHPNAVAYTGATTIIIMEASEYKKGEMIATRKAYGTALALLGDVCDAVISLDAEVKNSTYADIFEAVHPERFFQCFVAEQNMVGMGIGFDCRGRIPFISTFSSFFSRAHDQIRMAAIGNAALRLVGSHCGVSIGQDGPSQMGLEDIALMRCLPNSIVLYPSDAVSTHKLVEQMARYSDGISYLRTTRMNTPVLYDNDVEFPIGGCKVLRTSDQDVACVIAAGVTLHEALKAYDVLAKDNVFISVIDLYSIKPLDVATVISVARASNNKIITVEDHYPEGGIGEAIATALCNEGIIIHSLAVTHLPRSGTPEQLLAFENIDAAAIVKAVSK